MLHGTGQVSPGTDGPSSPKSQGLPAADQQHPKVIPFSAGKGHGGMEEPPGHPWGAQPLTGQSWDQVCSCFSTLTPFFQGLGALGPSSAASPTLPILSPTLSETFRCLLELQSLFPGDTSAFGGPAPLSADQNKPKKPPNDFPELSPPLPRVGIELFSGVAERGSCASSRYSRAKGPIPGMLDAEFGGCPSLPHRLGAFHVHSLLRAPLPTTRQPSSQG